jgi:CubicO group peptidase (beta-lactamase class C family)
MPAQASPILESRLEGISRLLEERAKQHRVPGAVLAVLEGDAIFQAATGVVNVDTGVETTPDAVFEIGSITKVFTTTLLMQLVDEGRVDLDATVRRYLPELELASRALAEAVTVRQLLTHTSGIDGDFFQDTGRGDDALERYVLACAALPQLHPPGKLWSYCNAGFNLVGRIVEKLRGTTWDQALRDHLLAPAGTEGMGSLAEDALRFRAAVGHFPDPKTGVSSVIPAFIRMRSNAPAGATPFAMARDLLAFARLHWDGGVARSGARVLSDASVRAMQAKQVDLPERSLASAWGLGWMLFDWGGARLVGHDGGTAGQYSFLRVLPERRLAVAMLTNGGAAPFLYRDVFGEVLGRLAGVRPPPLPEPDPGLVLDLERYTGSYERLASRIDVFVEEGKLMGRVTSLRPIFPMPDPPPIALAPIDEHRFLVRLPPSGLPAVAGALEFDERGRAGYVLAGGRLHRRIG